MCAGKSEVAVVKLKERPGSAAPPVKAEPAPRADQEPLGVSVEEATVGEGGDPLGVRISSVDVRGIAYRHGVREGDIVIDVDGKTVTTRDAFQRAVGPKPAQGVTRLFVRRGGRPLFLGLRRNQTGPEEASRF